MSARYYAKRKERGGMSAESVMRAKIVAICSVAIDGRQRDKYCKDIANMINIRHPGLQ